MYRFPLCLLGKKITFWAPPHVIRNIWLSEKRSCCLELVKYNLGCRLSFTGRKNKTKKTFFKSEVKSLRGVLCSPEGCKVLVTVNSTFLNKMTPEMWKAKVNSWCLLMTLLNANKVLEKGWGGGNWIRCLGLNMRIKNLFCYLQQYLELALCFRVWTLLALRAQRFISCYIPEAVWNRGLAAFRFFVVIGH